MPPLPQNVAQRRRSSGAPLSVDGDPREGEVLGNFASLLRSPHHGTVCANHARKLAIFLCSHCRSPRQPKGGGGQFAKGTPAWGPRPHGARVLAQRLCLQDFAHNNTHGHERFRAFAANFVNSPRKPGSFLLSHPRMKGKATWA